MQGPVTIDASVFLSAANPSEADHDASRLLLEEVRRDRVPVIVPTLVVPEVTAGARRSTGSADIAREMASTLEAGSALVFVPLDEVLAFSAADIAAEGALRGSDAVYGATARRFGAVLITLDRQQRERMPADITTVSPEAVLGGNG